MTPPPPERIQVPRMSDVSLVGYCPACGGAGRPSLVAREASGAISCTAKDCPDPMMVTTLLTQDAAEAAHIVVIEPGSWAIRHPLRERIGNLLEDCPLAPYVAGLGDIQEPGRYRVYSFAGDWAWESLS